MKANENLVDLTIEVNKGLLQEALGNEKMVSFGHQGTHFDSMDKVFPVDYAIRQAVVFDVSAVSNGEITIENVDISLIQEGMFVAFCTGFIEEIGYGSKEYFTNHPYLSWELIDFLLEKKVAIIGVDFAGVRRGKEHTPTDQKCADKGVFIVENLCNLANILQKQSSAQFTAYTFPIKFSGLTGLPCRVLGQKID